MRVFADRIETEKGEPELRSCWECNPAHDYLKEHSALKCCFECGRYYCFDRFLDSFEGLPVGRQSKSEGIYFENILEWLRRKCGYKEGEKTSKISPSKAMIFKGQIKFRASAQMGKEE